MVRGGEELLQWEVFSPISPQVCSHVACFHNGCIYVHGGLTNACDSRSVTSKLHRFSFESRIWNEIRIPDLPALSGHAAVVFEDNLILIGGWNGKERVSQVYVINLSHETLRTPSVSGFPRGAGLSAHTATLLNDNSIIVIGREGGIRTQRKSGDVFVLKGLPSMKSFTYTDYPLHVSSRSNHTTTPFRNFLITVGGREDNFIEFNKFNNAQLKGLQSQMSSQNFAQYFNGAKELKKQPSGRKSHVSWLSTDGYLMLHGGETFDGKLREPSGELLLFNLDTSQWRSIGTSVARAAHQLIVDEASGNVFIHGGTYGKKYFISGELLRLANGRGGKEG